MLAIELIPQLVQVLFILLFKSHFTRSFFQNVFLISQRRNGTNATNFYQFSGKGYITKGLNLHKTN